ncbi:MAG: efflux RND transporter periplasmic adaptor subunit [Rhodoferax sp.]|nr:MAG: efflux RND transporter periplasmic adaptor subunit [Rhodoferax sp.]
MQRFALQPTTVRVLASTIAVAAALGLWAVNSQAADPAKPAVAPKAALTVSTVQPQSTQLTVALAANGSIAAWQEASVGSEANGLRVAELHAAVGDKVQKGQLLVSFAAEGVQADVALARAALAEAQAMAAESQANADRARAVKDSGALSAQQVSQYLTAELSAKARVASAQAQLDAQLLRLKNTQVHAPDSGIISARNATVGAVVGAGTELYRLIRQGRLEWRGEVTAAELARVAPGTTVQVTAAGGAQVKGRVRTVAPTVDAQTRNGMVYVDLPGAKGFKPGMFARGEFALGASSALTVPQSAVVVRDGFSYVYRVGADSKVKQLKVQTGRVAGDQLEVLSGVQAQDKLVASGGSFLSDGDLVKVVDAASKQAPSPANAAQAATK